MRSVFTIALLLVASSAELAHAQNEARELRQVLFGGMDRSAGSTFGSAGFKRALAGSIDAPGWIVMGVSGLGTTRDVLVTEAGRVGSIRASGEASLLAGRQWSAGAAFATLSIGPTVEYDRSLGTAAAPARPPRFGASVIADVWLHHSDAFTTDLTLVATTARPSAWARASAGWTIAGNLRAGPEASLYAEPGYREARFGLHLAGLTFAGLNLRLSGGFSHVDAKRHGGYFSLSAYIKM